MWTKPPAHVLLPFCVSSKPWDKASTRPSAAAIQKRKQPSIIHHQISGDEDSSKLQWVDPPGVSKTDYKSWKLQTHLDPIQKANGTSSYVLDAASYFFWYGAWLMDPFRWLSLSWPFGERERSPSWSSAKQWCTAHSCAALGSGIQDNSTAPITRLCVHMWIYIFKKMYMKIQCIYIYISSLYPSALKWEQLQIHNTADVHQSTCITFSAKPSGFQSSSSIRLLFTNRYAVGTLLTTSPPMQKKNILVYKRLSSTCSNTLLFASSLSYPL